MLTCIGDRHQIDNGSFIKDYLDEHYPGKGYGKLLYGDNLKANQKIASLFIDRVQGGTYTHFHCIDDEAMLSLEDIKLLFETHLKCIRAVSKHKTYVIILEDNMIGKYGYQVSFINAFKKAKYFADIYEYIMTLSDEKKEINYNRIMAERFKKELEPYGLANCFFIEE